MIFYCYIPAIRQIDQKWIFFGSLFEDLRASISRSVTKSRLNGHMLINIYITSKTCLYNGSKRMKIALILNLIRLSLRGEAINYRPYASPSLVSSGGLVVKHPALGANGRRFEPARGRNFSRD